MNWGLEFIGVINPPSSVGHRWVLTAIDYFAKWTEAVALKDVNESAILSFYEDLVYKFLVPDLIISNNALAFVGNKIAEWVVKQGVYLNASSNYYR